MSKILNILFGDPNKKMLHILKKDVERINAFEPEIQKLTNELLKAKTQEFKNRLAQKESLENLLFEAYAVVREVAKRQLGQRHYDVQLIGGMVMHRGGIAEMRTGEGKTLTATLPLYLNALTEKGCHLVTVNDYLARRDTVWMGQIFFALGMQVACIQHEGGFLYDPTYKHEEHSEQEEQHDEQRDTTGSFKIHEDYLRPVSRKEAYAADITYGTNNEFGFDYLRDNMVMRFEDMVQRKHLYFAIVDEVDSILIDEARTPLIISAAAEESDSLYKQFAQIAKTLKENEDYNVDEKMRAVTLTEKGVSQFEKVLGIENLYTESGITFIHHAEQALQAHALFQKDKDYVVRDGEVVIVDEFTGRFMEGRRYSEGLHQAIEAKEQVEIKKESQTLATITFQNYFRMYEKLAGMTGTGITEAEEFGKIYDLDVTAIPTHKLNQRKDLPDRIYKTQVGKMQAAVQEIKRIHATGQPILVGTASIERNEVLSSFLKKAQIPHEMLNAKNHEKEGEIIAQAGRPGAVTIATNMAGRGVDIVLGGNPPDEKEAEKVKKIGGLFVLGTDRHEARRIDNQLRGRSGRQGDPGMTQFYISTEDDLMRIFGSERIKNMMNRLGIPDDQPIENTFVSNSIEKAQKRVEGYHFDGRKHLLEYDDVLNKHRELIYDRRREVLEAYAQEDQGIFRQKILEIFEDVVEQIVFFHTEPGMQETGKEPVKTSFEEIIETAEAMIPLKEQTKNVLKECGLTQLEQKQKTQLAQFRTKLIEIILGAAQEIYNQIESEFDRNILKDLERNVLLRSIDRLWIEHLCNMKALRTGIGLRGYGQQDPLIEYKKEAFGMFNQLLSSINQEVANNFFKYTARAAQMQKAALQTKSLFERAGIVLSGAQKSTGNEEKQQASVKQEKVGRNDLCPCGSGKKYKKCHGV